MFKELKNYYVVKILCYGDKLETAAAFKNMALAVYFQRSIEKDLEFTSYLYRVTGDKEERLNA